MTMSSTFADLADYHDAAIHPPDKIITEKVLDIDPDTGRVIHKEIPRHLGLRGRPLKTKTWKEEAHTSSESIAAKLMSERRWPGKEPMPEWEAIGLRERIIAEIDPKDVPRGLVFTHGMWHAQELKPGDSFLVPYKGWVENYWRWQRKAFPKIAERAQESVLRICGRIFRRQNSRRWNWNCL